MRPWAGGSFAPRFDGSSHVCLAVLFNLLPSISRCALRSKKDLLELMDESVRFTSWVGLLAGGLLMATAPDLLALLYGPNFREAARSFSVLVWMLPVAMLGGITAISRSRTDGRAPAALHFSVGRFGGDSRPCPGSTLRRTRRGVGAAYRQYR